MTHCAARSSSTSPTTSRSSKTTHRCQPRASPIFACRCRPTNPSAAMKSALAHVQGPPLPSSMDLYWNQQLIDVLLEYPIRSDRSEFAIQPARRPVRPDGHDHASLPDARRRNAGIRVSRRSRPDRARSALAPGCTALRGVGLLAHPRRHRSPAVSAVPRASVPAVAAARHHRHRVHGRPLDLADRGGLRFRAGRALVSAAGRDADRHHHRLHGAGEYRSGREGNPQRKRRRVSLDHRFRVRRRARIRIFVRVARIPAVRRRPSRLVAVRLQYRRRARPDRRAARAGPGARTAVPVRGPRTPRHHHHIGAGGAHRLALDARTRRVSSRNFRSPRSTPPSSPARCAGSWPR